MPTIRRTLRRATGRQAQGLAEQLQFFRAVIDTIPNCIFVKSREGRYILVNKALAGWRGLMVGEFEGKLDSEINPDAEQVAKFRRDDREVMDTLKEKFVPEEKLINRAGACMWVQTIKRPLIPPGGTARQVLGVLTDITGHKRTELYLNSILENLPVAVFIKEAKELRFVLWNKANEELCGFSKEQVIGKRDYDFFPKEQADFFTGKDREVLQGGKLLEVEEQISTRHRGTRLLRTRKIPLLDESGQPLCLLGISEDITERKETEAKLEQAHKQLVEASRHAGMAEVATSVLHNIGNVLNSINVSVSVVGEHVKTSKVASLARVGDLLRDHAADLGRFLTEDPKGKLLPNYIAQLIGRIEAEHASILSEIEAMRNDVDHINDIVAMQQNYAKVVGVNEPVRAVDLVEDALRMNASALLRRDVEIVRDYAPELPQVTVDKHKVLQILVNLIQNAKYACDESGKPCGQLTLRVRVCAGGERVCVDVGDNGVGIPPENLTRIFNHGFTTRRDGHGFGLHSSALTARELGGSLSARSEGIGKGATFALEIPCRPPPAGG